MAARTSLEDMGIGVTGPTPLLGDNKALNDLVMEPGATARTKYYERAVLIVKRLYTLLVVSPFLILTKFMIADVFTKALDRDAFITFRDYMLNVENGPEPYAEEQYAPPLFPSCAGTSMRFSSTNFVNMSAIVGENLL